MPSVVDPLLIQQVADRLAPELRSAFVAVVGTISDRIPVTQLEALLRANDIPGILRLVEAAIAGSLNVAATPVVAALTRLVNSTYKTTLTLAGVASSFRLTNPRAVEWIRSQAALQVTYVARDTQLAIRRIVLNGYLDGLGSAATGRLIRSSVGLLPAHAVAVGNYTRGLVAAGYPANVVEHNTALYQNRLLNYRAETIARTESINAAVAGQYAAWQHQVAIGILQRHRTWVEWMVTEDDRLCPWCAPMDGVRVRIGEMFVATHKGFPDGKPTLHGLGSQRRRQSPIKPDPRSQPRDHLGRFTTITKRDTRTHLDNRLVELPAAITVQHPPLHPNCRCALVLRFED